MVNHLLSLDIQLNTLPGIVFAMIMILITLASATAIVRSSVVRTTSESLKLQVEALRGDRDDFKLRLEESQKEQVDLKHQLEVQTLRCDTLERLVNAKHEFDQVLDKLSIQQERTERIERAVQEVRDLVRGRLAGGTGNG